MCPVNIYEGEYGYVWSEYLWKWI